MIVLITVIFLLIIITSLLSWYIFVLYKYKSLKVIPGPQAVPLLGNVMQVGKTPEEFFEKCLDLSEKYGDIFKVYIGAELRVLIAKPELIEQVLSSNVHTIKSNGYQLLSPWLGEGLLVSAGKKWKSRRKLITPTFHFKILESFVQVFNSCGDVLVERLAQEVGDKSFDLYPYINLCAFDMICRTSMGIEHSFQEGNDSEYVQTVREWLDISTKRLFSPWERIDFLFQLFSRNARTFNKYLKILHDFADNTIRKRRLSRETTQEPKIKGKKRVALLDMLLEAEESCMLSHNDIKEEINTILFEGHDTTSSGIAFTLLSLAENPQYQDKVYEEIESIIEDKKIITMDQLQNMKYLDMVIKEALRMYPSVPIVERRLETDWSVGGYHFPKDTTLTLFLYGLHQNKEYYPDAHRFDPERFLPENQSKRHIYSYTPFSAGPRNCIGQKFAMLGMKTIFIKILQKFRLVRDPRFTAKLGIAAVLKSYNGIYVKLERR